MMMKAQEALFEVNKSVHRIEHANEETVPIDFSNQMRKLDTHIVSLMSEADRHTLTTFNEAAETNVAQNMWMISRMFIHA